MSESSNELDNQIELMAELFEQIEETVDVCTAELDELGDSLEEMDEQIALLEQEQESVLESFEEMHDAVSSGMNDLLENIETVAEDRVEHLVGTKEEVSSNLEDQRMAFQESLTKIVDCFTRALTDGWLEKTRSELLKSDDLFESCFEVTLKDLANMGEHIEDWIRSGIEELRDYIEGRLRAIVEEQGQEILDSAVERLADEVVDAIMTSQLQVQTTAYLSPYIPHLAVAKAVAPAIRQGLEIMRAGF